MDRDVGRGEGEGLRGLFRAQPGLSSSSDSWAPSDPPYLVLRCLSFLFGFLKKITNFMKVEVRC